MSCSMEIIQFLEECEQDNIIDNWEVYYNINIGHTDDYDKFDKNTNIDIVKNKCIELGSRLFVTKDNCQYYIRSPPFIKKNRDYKSIKQKIDTTPSNSNYNSYLLNY